LRRSGDQFLHHGLAGAGAGISVGHRTVWRYNRLDRRQTALVLSELVPHRRGAPGEDALVAALRPAMSARPPITRECRTQQKRLPRSGFTPPNFSAAHTAALAALLASGRRGELTAGRAER